MLTWNMEMCLTIVHSDAWENLEAIYMKSDSNVGYFTKYSTWQMSQTKSNKQFEKSDL